MGRSRPDLGGQLQEQSTPAPRSLPQPTPRPFSPSLQKCLPETLWRVWAWGQEPISLNGPAINLSLLPALMLRWFDLLCRAHEFVFSNKTQIFTPLLKNSPWLLMSRLIKTKRLNEACEGPFQAQVLPSVALYLTAPALRSCVHGSVHAPRCFCLMRGHKALRPQHTCYLSLYLPGPPPTTRVPGLGRVLNAEPTGRTSTRFTLRALSLPTS